MHTEIEKYYRSLIKDRISFLPRKHKLEFLRNTGPVEKIKQYSLDTALRELDRIISDLDIVTDLNYGECIGVGMIKNGSGEIDASLYCRVDINNILVLNGGWGLSCVPEHEYVVVLRNLPEMGWRQGAQYVIDYCKNNEISPLHIPEKYYSGKEDNFSIPSEEADLIEIAF